MVDQMIRAAARSIQGVAHPLSLDDKGGLRVSDRAAKSFYGMRKDLYYEGVEVDSFSQSYKLGNGTIRKTDDYIELEVHDNPNNLADLSISSDSAIDLTDIDTLYIEFDLEVSNNINSTLWFIVGTTRVQSYQYGVKKEAVTTSGGKSIRKQILRMNVSELDGEHFVRAHLRDMSSATDAPSKLRIYSIWGETATPRMSAQSQSSLTVQDLNGKPVTLSAEVDPEGNATLRIVDAAPHAYDPVEDRLETNYKAMEVIVEKEGITTIPASGNLEVMFNTPVNNYKRIMVVYRLATTAENTHIKVVTENRLVGSGFVVYGEEKTGQAGKYGHKAEFDLAFPRVNVILTNTSGNPINLQRYAVIGVK